MNPFSSVRAWWASEAPADRLGILRFAIGGYALWYLSTRAGLVLDLAREDPQLFRPAGVIRLLGGPWPRELVAGLVWATLASGVAFVLGLFHRWSGPLFALGFLTAMCYRNSWSMLYHSHNALVFHVAILGFTRAADGFSLDALRRGWRAERRDPPRSWDQAWPIRAICAVTAVGYLLAGIAKLAGPQGWAWADGAVLREQIAADAVRKEVLEGASLEWAHLLYDQAWLFTAIGCGTYLLELGAPLCLFHPRLSRLWALGTWGMHLGIWFLMGIEFRYQLCFAIFLPYFEVEHLWRRARAALPARWGGSGAARTSSG